MCVRACPRKALQVINLPRVLEGEVVHRFGRNGFRLHRLPQPRPRRVLGLVGQNGIGKTTALEILSDKIRPNLGILDPSQLPSWEAIIAHFRGSDLQMYLNHLVGGQLRVMKKPQYVDPLAYVSRQTLGEILQSKDQLGKFDVICRELHLAALLERQPNQLSGGELQRFAIALVAVQQVGAKFFDEPSSYLDIGQRMRASRVVRGCVERECESEYVVVIEHDLAILDYMSDFVHVLYGQPGGFGVVTAPATVREGINHFLRGYIPSENMRFRRDELIWRPVDDQDEPALDGEIRHFHYPTMSLELGTFHLEVIGGEYRNGEIIVLLGENGVGKTTFIRLLSRQPQLQPTHVDLSVCWSEMKVSYKPQKIEPKFEGTVQQLLEMRAPSALINPMFRETVMTPMNLEYLMDRKVKKLSGGELQRVALTLALSQNADLYLIDEPSAFLDAEQRVVIAKVLKRYVMNTGKTAFVVEHDFMMATYLANRVVIFEGTPGVSTRALAPEGLVRGMNYFLRQMDVTLRAEQTTHRPRINKFNSVKDREQKAKGSYFVQDVRTQASKGEA